MNAEFTYRVSWNGFPFCTLIAVFAFCPGLTSNLCCQTASTGALTGVTLDVSGALLPGVSIKATKDDGNETRLTVSDGEGSFALLFLPPGSYHLQADKSDFEPLSLSALRISVTETLGLELHLHLATRVERVRVSSESAMVQTDSSALGRVFNETAIRQLPLVTRNFTQLTGLSPGVAVGVYNAGELGSGGTALSQVGASNDGVFVHGSRSYDNNWQLDGVSVSDVLASGGASGGIPIPNPDSLQEFKVQTGLYDASFGRAAGANVSLITKAGTNHYYGTLFEYLRNNVLNANDFFLNQTGRPRPDLKQNQFGAALGGPIEKDRLLAFASYQGTRQVNGLAAGQARIGCAASLSEPPITNDRSPAALGRLFGGMNGALGGVAIKSDGSNINPVALALLNFKLPDGILLISTPQTVDPAKPFASSGFSSFSLPCSFDEDQGLANLDYVASKNSRIAARFFIARSDQLVTVPGSGRNPVANTRGFDSAGGSDFIVFSLAHTYIASSAFLNDARLGFVRTKTRSGSQAPFKWSDVGVAEGAMNDNNELPNLNILGSVSMASAIPRIYTQNTFSLSDTFSLVSGAHAMKFGGEIARLKEYFDIVGIGSSVQFLSWPDFLLGLGANDNGTGRFSNVFASSDNYGLLNRNFAAWEGSAFAQDDFRITRTFTLNAGLRYERIGQFGDDLGKNSSFDFGKAAANPPPSGTLAGYIVASNFPGTIPPGVIRADNTFGTYGKGQNTIAPRIGFAWQIVRALLLRGGYGMYYSRPTGQASAASISGAPFSSFRSSTGQANAAATFQSPFAQPFPNPSSFPMFVPYAASTNLTVQSPSPNFRAALSQQFSLNIQAELRQSWLLEMGYVGARGTHLQRFRSLNQAADASPDDPVRGVTSNTLANIASRVPIPGITPDFLRQLESDGSSWYNAFESSLTKRFVRGFQFLASYTFSKTLDTDGANINGTSAGSTLTLGDQNSPSQRWGRASFDRTHRFVFSTTWTIPGPLHGLSRTVLGNWSLAGIATVQSGSALTVIYTNSTNVFGISEDRAQLSGACSNGQFVAKGPVESKLNGYFNSACFTKPPIIGADGIGATFGNSATGLVDGPGQANVDLALSKTIALSWPTENSSLRFRGEFYNALNHPQFANPDTNFSSSTFGIIVSTAVNPRVGQLALTFAF